MLKLTIPVSEDWDERTSTFIYGEEITLELEHSLVSLSKWESIWEKPFIGDTEKSNEETLSYIQCMAVSQEITPELLHRLNTNEHLTKINTYIDAKMSATWFNEKPKPGQAKKSKETITSELIYYWMGIYKIWKDCETWHLNRLFTLIKVHSAESERNSGTNKPRNKADMMAERRKLNEQRKAAHKTNG